ncbi:MAG: molybdopterin-synthase adenylyltransferase MoeB [Vicinamibacteraceae bacterium]|nr:molybdopterin-synthase adenylyltransferase MoeB [Vicinamibacteraceae bacterium]
MPTLLYVPTPLRSHVGQRDAVEVTGTTVREAIDDLLARYESLRTHLYDENGRLRRFINVYVNDEDIRYLQREATPLAEGDTISLVPSVAGGSPEAVTASVPLPELTPAEFARYNRHVILPEVGVDGQRRLKASRVLCVGAGGLGSPASLYLAAAGVGHIGLVDFDVVDVSNLQRQVLFSTEQIGVSKLEAARARLGGLNPEIEIATHAERLTSDNAFRLFEGYDLILDGTDNFATRYLVNDACVLLGIPNVYGSIFRFEGQASVFATRGGPCYRCLYPEPPPPGLIPSCAEGGVFGVLPGIVGTIQATEAIKLLTGVGEPLIGRFLVYDALRMRFRELTLRRDPECPVCGDRPTITSLVDYEQFCGAPAPAAAPETPPAAARIVDDLETTVESLKARLDRGDEFLLLDVREPHELQICRIDAPGGLHVPMGEIPRRHGELDRSKDLIVYCRSGQRSGRVVGFLRQQGFDRAVNLKGGVLEWIDRIDPSQPKY